MGNDGSLTTIIAIADSDGITFEDGEVIMPSRFVMGCVSSRTVFFAVWMEEEGGWAWGDDTRTETYITNPRLGLDDKIKENWSWNEDLEWFVYEDSSYLYQIMEGATEIRIWFNLTKLSFDITNLMNTEAQDVIESCR